MISKEEAFEILGLTRKSTESDIEMRYAILIKRYRAEKNKEKLDEVSLAYNLITGVYVEPIKEDPKMKKVVWGKSRSEWKNIWYYGKLKYFVFLVIALFIGYIIYTMATNTPADFKIAAIGEFAVEDVKITEDYAKSLYPDFKKVEISPLFMDNSTDSSYYGTAYVQKAVILFSAAGEDLIIVDRAMFDKYASSGAFKPIGDVYAALLAMDGTKDLGLESVKATIPTNSDGSGTEEIYGIDVSKSQMLNAIGICGRDQIITVSVKSEREALAKEFITKLFTDTKKLLPQVTLIPEATPTPIPTVTLAPTP